ncbi:MAG: DUF2029 domain-containing protein [Planctomycetes bacterium]|nr:DUF2029 domain-containing protein [Planctomycetota bacterium]
MRWTRQHTAAVGALLFAGLLASLVVRGFWKCRVVGEGRPNDFHAYYTAARGALEGDLRPSYRDPVRPNLYPPPFAILVAPLGLLPYRGAAALWVLLNAGLVVWIFRSLDRVLGLTLPALGKTAGFLLAYRCLDSDFGNGNANTLVLALVLSAFAWTRRRGEGIAGAILSLAIVAKVTPVLILPWALYRRRWRFLAGALAGLLLIAGLLPVLVLGPRGAGDAWRAWHDVTLRHIDPRSESYAARSGEGYEPGQSLRVLLHRLLRASDATARDGRYITIHLADLPKGAADGIYLGAAAAVLAAALAAAWRRAPGARLGWRAEEVAAACAAMVLLAPLSRKAHFVALWPAAVLGFEAWRQAESPRLRKVGSGLWALALVLVAGTSPGFAGRETATLLLAYCPIGWAAAALLVLVSYSRFYPAGGLTAADLGGRGPPRPAPG